MAQTIVIPQGDKNLNDVTKITPDTRVNHKSDVKYPTDVYDGSKQNSMVAESWVEGDVTFTNPHEINSDASTESSGS